MLTCNRCGGILSVTAVPGDVTALTPEKDCIPTAILWGCMECSITIAKRLLLYIEGGKDEGVMI